MKTYYARLQIFILFSVLPLLAGCLGGGGGAGTGGGVGLSGVVTTPQSGVELLFNPEIGGSGGGVSQNFAAALLTNPGSGEAMATIHNPEPISMLLVGGGMAAMMMFRHKQL